MNQIVIVTLIVYALAWLIYIAGLRDKRFAFTLWFPITATSFLGTLVWLWVTLALLTAPKSGDAAIGFALMGAAIAFGVFLICPIVFAISIWQRPVAGAYGLIQTLPIVLIYFGLLLSYRSISESIENRNLQVTVQDTQKRPIAHAKVKYETYQKSDATFSFPSAAMSGIAETADDGTVTVPVPQTHEIDCEVSANGYASLRIRMDRAWSQFNWHQTWIDWQFPPEDPKKSWERHGGSVQTDVDDSNSMHLTVYLPQTTREAIPNYGPMRIYHEEQGKIWTSEPSTVRTQ